MISLLHDSKFNSMLMWSRRGWRLNNEALRTNWTILACQFMIRRSLAGLCVSKFILCNTLVRSNLENAMLMAYAWNESSGFWRGLVKIFCQIPYEKRLQRLSLQLFTRRRLCGDLIASYKEFSGGSGLEPSLFFIPPLRPGLRGHPSKWTWNNLFPDVLRVTTMLFHWSLSTRFHCCYDSSV